MATYCRITGKSRGLPKPNYFPLLPPISPADAKRLCKITGKAYGLPSHHYIPVLSGKPKKKKSKGGKNHVFLDGYNYYSPCLEESKSLKDVLKDKDSPSGARYVYIVKEKKCGLVFPANLEEAVREGQVRDVMLSSDSDSILVKLKRGINISVDVKEIKPETLTGDIFEGSGSSAVPRKATETNEKVKLFEDKEKASEEIPKIQVKHRKTEVREWKNAETSGENLSFANNVDFDTWTWEDFTAVEGEPISSYLPSPIKVEPKIIPLGQSTPGIVQQPYHCNDFVGFNVINVVAPFKPLIVESDTVLLKSLKDMKKADLKKTVNATQVLHEKIEILPEIQDISSLLECLPSGSEMVEEINGQRVNGLKLMIGSEAKFIIGQSLKTKDGIIFVPGQSVPTINGGFNFVPGITVNTGNEIKLLPGQVIEVNKEPVFIVGQNVLTRDGEKFVQGQTMVTKDGVKFTPGQTIITETGSKFVPGQILEDRFYPGQIMQSSEGVEFVCGQTMETPKGNVFIAGQSVWSERGWEFVPGKTCRKDSAPEFVPGIIVDSGNKEENFVPGRYAKDGEENVFVPGLTVERDGVSTFVCGTTIQTPEGKKFVEGQIVKNSDKLKFVPGKSEILEGVVQFTPAQCAENVEIHASTHECKSIPCTSVQPDLYANGVFGQIVHSRHGVEFFPGSPSALPAGKVVPGKLVRGKEVKFVPGIMSEGRFVPGQVVTTGAGEEFVPGQVVETAEGAKFVPGQIISTKTGPKFVPGQIVHLEDGPKFIPGQIVETNSGPTFIPGQVLHIEDEGSKFVPGQVVETKEGPRFVPGRVIEDGDRVVFVPGQVVETEEGLRFVAPDLNDDENEFTVQGFDVSPEELGLVQPDSTSVNAADVKEMAIDSKMLRQLSEAGMAIGRQVPTEIPVVDIHSAPAVSVACSLANKLNLDPVSTAKMSQIFTAVVQLGKIGEIPGSGPEVALLNSLLERVVHCKTEDESFQLLASIMEKEIGLSTTATVDDLHFYLTSKESPLKRLNKVNILKEIVNENVSHDQLVDKLSTVLNEEDKTVCSALRKFSECNPEIVDMIVERVVETMGMIESEKDAVETIHRAVVATVREASEMSIVDLLKDTENLGLKELLLGAVCLAKALDMMDVASGLLDIVSNPRCTDILAGDRVTLEILRRLTVMKQLAQKRPELLSALSNLQQDPYSARTDPSLKELVRESGALLVIPEEGISSEAVPSSLLFSQNSLAMEEFLTRTKRTCPILVIIKKGIQAIIPREASHSVLTGSVPYAVLDEKGLHHFQPKHVFAALRLPKIATNWFSTYKCDIIDSVKENDNTTILESSTE